MKNIPLGRSDYQRATYNEAALILRNRYFEENPILNEQATALLARPGMKRAISAGVGPIRGVFSSPGAFSDNLFVVSGVALYRVDAYGTATYIGDVGTSDTASVTFAATGTIGDVPNHLFLCDGGVLWVYTDNGYAHQTLTAAGAIANNDTVQINGVYYKWTNGAVDAGTPLGTLANPWLVKLDISNALALEHLYDAIGDTGVIGTDYSTALTPHATVTAYVATATTVSVRANVYGTAGNAYSTTETGANISWGAATMAGGGAATLFQVPTPDDVGAISLGHIASYIIVVPTQGVGVNGRFYWIEPGEITIDPLNYATAERSPDAVYQVVIFGDQFWLLGQSTTETWVPTGNPDAPMQRFQGVLFDRGTWKGTGIQVKDSLILVDSEGGVFQVGGGLKRISRPDIEGRIRKAIQEQSLDGF